VSAGGKAADGTPDGVSANGMSVEGTGTETRVAANPLRAGLEDVRSALPATIVIFGATGDLTRRKLLPALYNLARDGALHPETAVVGFARRDWNDDAFRSEMRSGIEAFSRRKPVEEGVWERLAANMRYVTGDFEDAQAYGALETLLDRIEGERSEPGMRLFYLAAPPVAYDAIVAHLRQASLVRPLGQPGGSRIVVEKPLGHDLASARELNQRLAGAFDESQIFRIDHYLGKETVQNILVFRLDNGIFEPVWNRSYVDHVQITVAETEGVGTRAGYYEQAGVSRDMLQNHLLQLLTLVCMEPPVRIEAKAVRDEKVKVLEAIRGFTPDTVASRTVRGQYRRGIVEGNEVPGYLEEAGVRPGSTTETYLAARFEVGTWRWAGTPFYLRSGKRLPKRASEIAIVFKRPPYELLRRESGTRPEPNVLRLRIQPEERISLSFETKVPGRSLRVEEVRMDFSYATSFGGESPEAYERLLLDAVQGDATLFAREDEVELSWKLADAITGAWAAGAPGAPGPYPYEAGSWGPLEADQLLEREGRRWLRI
jgi:glucose-6-phosphate 1-dehydrogenase